LPTRSSSDGTARKLTITEEKLIAAYRAIVEKQTDLSNSLADHLDLLGKIANVPIKQNTDDITTKAIVFIIYSSWYLMFQGC
jgi:hypothetical protein